MLETDEQSVHSLGKEIFTYTKSNGRLRDWLNKQLLSLCMSDPKLQNQLFRFVDVLPSLKSDEETVRYLFEYLCEANPRFIALQKLFVADVNKKGFSPSSGNLLKTVGLNGIITKIVSGSIKFGAKNVARTFIAGANLQEALNKIKQLEAQGLTYTLDILGEFAVSELESQQYFDQYMQVMHQIPQTNLSIKLSSLYSQINPLAFDLSKNILKDKLRLIFKAAQFNNSFVNVDMEHYYWKDLSSAVITELLMEKEFRTWRNVGTVVQAYLKSSKRDLEDLIAWAKFRQTPVTVRLVKGAYWDYEKAIAEQKGWNCPVFISKNETDANFEELTTLLFENYKYLKPAIASHNIRSVAYALNCAQQLQLRNNQYEFQLLYGMLDPLKKYLSSKGVVTRVYLPFGDLIPGMAYLVRRLLENTANNSFLRQGFLDIKSGIDEDELLRSPAPVPPNKSGMTVNSTAEPFINEPNLDFSKATNRHLMKKALKDLDNKLKSKDLYPLIINSEKIYKRHTLNSINPCQFARSLGKISLAEQKDCDKALLCAENAFALWSNTDVSLRAKIFRKMASVLRKERLRFNSLLILEAAKPWIEADAEVSEAIDFLEYYSDQAVKLFGSQELKSLSGESNINNYQPYGVSLIISPWNFPLAIMSGMTVASLAAANTAIVKPSQETNIVAYEYIKILDQIICEETQKALGKSIRGVVNFLPGEAKIIGNYLVEHPIIKLIAFTGSSEVGLNINARANNEAFNQVYKSYPKQVIAEMGGKNTIIIDGSADLDEAVPGVMYSAFGYAGQKCSACSRVVILASVYKHFVERLVEASKSIIVGKADCENTYVPALINEAAFNKASEYINYGKQTAQMLLGDMRVPMDGYFVSPTIFYSEDPNGKLAQEEIFGPVLTILKADNIDDALRIANNTVYGLTGGIYSRSPRNIQKAINEFNVGNLYINRHCTGAIVSRQAFGGLKLSSIGFKAGGPNYLLQFVREKTITENTMRRGFSIE